MQKIATLLVVIFAGHFLLGVASAAADGWKAEILDYGIYDIDRGGKESNEAVASDLVVVHGKSLQKQTDQIPGKLGVNFGFRYKLTGPEDNVELTMKVLHPKALVDPHSGRSYKVSEWSSLSFPGDDNTNSGWTFEQEWEIAEGKWTMQLWQGRALLAAKDFIIKKP